MTGTVNCVYKTPCGWCAKWDKECDEQKYTSSYRRTHPQPITENDKLSRYLKKIANGEDTTPEDLEF